MAVACICVLVLIVLFLLYQIRGKNKQIKKWKEEAHEQALNVKYQKLLNEGICKAHNIKVPLEVYELGAVDVAWRDVKEDSSPCHGCGCWDEDTGGCAVPPESRPFTCTADEVDASTT